jgi:hypothetical protein
MTTTSGGFTQALGLVEWYQRAASFKVVITETGASQSLTRDNLTSENTRIAWFVDYIGEAATLQTTDTSNLDIGTGDDFTHDWDNANSRYIIHSAGDGGRLDFGKAAIHTDVYFHAGDITTDYVLFDEGSLQMSFVDIDLLVDDESKLLIGDSGDVTIEYDESGNDLDITSTTALDLITFGATGDGYDLEWFSVTAGDYVLFDYSADAVLLEDVELFLGDGEGLYFGDNVGTGDFKISDETDVLTIAQVVADTGTMAIGADGTDIPLTWYAETASSFFKLTGDDVQLDAMSLCLGDSDQLQFGDALGTGDIKVYATGTDLIIDGVVAETGTVAIGVTDLGLDFKLWAATNAEGVLWDASDEALEFTGANLALDATSDLYDAVLVGTKVVSGIPVTIVFRPDAAATLTWTVPTGYDLIVTDAIGWKTAGAGAHADDEWSLQHNDGSAANIFDKEELNTIADKARILFDNLDDAENELEATETLDLVANENAANGCDGIIVVSGYLKTAD